MRKDRKKPMAPFMGILTAEEIRQGAARFTEEVNSKAIRLKATKVKTNNHNHSF